MDGGDRADAVRYVGTSNTENLEVERNRWVRILKTNNKIKIAIKKKSDILLQHERNFGNCVMQIIFMTISLQFAEATFHFCFSGSNVKH